MAVIVDMAVVDIAAEMVTIAIREKIVNYLMAD
jgi:hypothetical protein